MGTVRGPTWRRCWIWTFSDSSDTIRSTTTCRGAVAAEVSHVRTHTRTREHKNAHDAAVARDRRVVVCRCVPWRIRVRAEQGACGRRARCDAETKRASTALVSRAHQHAEERVRHRDEREVAHAAAAAAPTVRVRAEQLGEPARDGAVAVAAGEVVDDDRRVHDRRRNRERAQDLLPRPNVLPATEGGGGCGSPRGGERAVATSGQSRRGVASRRSIPRRDETRRDETTRDETRRRRARSDATTTMTTAPARRAAADGARRRASVSWSRVCAS